MRHKNIFRAIVINASIAIPLISSLIYCSGNSPFGKKAALPQEISSLATVVSAPSDSSKEIANAFPGSLALSVFPKPAAAGLRLNQSDDSFDPNAKSLKAKLAEQEALVRGTAESCLPAALEKTVNIGVETCYDFDQDMLYGSKDIGQTPIIWMGTKDGKSKSGEACLVSFTRTQAATVNALMDQTLGLGMAALCQQKKDHPLEVLPTPNAPIDLAASLRSLLGAGVSVSSATFEQLADNSGFPVYRIAIVATLSDGIKRSIGVLHSPHNSSNSEFSGSVYSVAEGIPTYLGLDDGEGEQKFQLLSISYTRTIDANTHAPTLNGELRTAHMAANLASTAITSDGVLDFNAGTNITTTPLADDTYGSHTAYSQASDALNNLTYLAFSLNPDTNEGKLSYWKNAGGGYYENARGFTISLGAPSAAGDSNGCVASGTASTDLNKGTSIRRFLNRAEAVNKLALTPVGFWHPLMNTPTATGSDANGTYKTKTLPSGAIAKWYLPSGGNSTFNDFYTSAVSGTLKAEQCFALSANATSYAVDTKKTPDPSGFAVADTTSDGDTAKFVVTPVPQETETKTASTYNFTGTISGLNTNGLVLSNKAGDILKIDSGAKTFSFATATLNSTMDLLSVSAQPSGYSCILASNLATIKAGNVSGLSITCSKNSYTIGGTISGLTTNGLTLGNNDSSLTVTSQATVFTFANPTASSSRYSVTVTSQPTGYFCSVANGSGTVIASNVSNIEIICSTTARTVGGTISGLGGSGLVLQNNAGTSLSVNADAATFIFPDAVASGGTYSVNIASQPSGYRCSVVNGSGPITSSNIATVGISCVHVYTIGGTISGLSTSGLVLQNNSGDNFSPSSGATSFLFTTPQTANSTYAVTVASQPTGYICTAANSSGTISSNNITGVGISCISTGAISCNVSGVGIASSATVGYNASTRACNASGYHGTGTLSAPCTSNGQNLTASGCISDASVTCNVTGTGIASNTTAAYNDTTHACNASAYHGTGTLSSTCTSNGQNITASGCISDASVTCNVTNVTGLSNATAAYNTSSGSVSCNAAGYSGSLTVPACTTNGSTLTVSSGSCSAITCPVTGTGIASSSTVAYNATTIACNATNYSGTATLSATCTSGAASTASGCVITLPVTANLALQLDATKSSTLTLSGSQVTAWADFSGSGHNLTAGTTPTYSSSLINGNPGLDFRGTSGGGGMTSAAFTNSSNASLVMVVVVRSTINNWGGFFHHGQRDNDLALEKNSLSSSPTALHFQTNNDNSGCDLSYTVDTPTILFGKMTSGTSRYFSATTTSGGTVSTTCTNSSSISIGSKTVYLGKSDVSEGSNSYIGELEYYTAALSDADRDSIISYLRTKWGI